MNNPFLHPGRGVALAAVTGSTGNVRATPPSTTIPDGGFSETFAGHSGKQILLELVFGAAATGNVLLEKVVDKEASVAGTTHATIAASAELTKSYAAPTPLTGQYRIKNSSGQNLTVYYNNVID